MNDIVPGRAQAEALRRYRPPSTSWFPEEFVWPRYDGYSVGNVPATLIRLLTGESAPAPCLPPLDPHLLAGLTDGVERVVTVVVDGLGWEQLQTVLARDASVAFHDIAAHGRLQPLTTVFPSTTNNVLATLRTGAAPMRHGLLAYTMFLREWQLAAECIGFSPLAQRHAVSLEAWGLDPETFLPVPSLAELLERWGVPSYQLMASHLISGPLTQMYFRGVRHIYGYHTASDFWLTLREMVQAHRRERCYLSAYWSAVDTLGHRHGPGGERGYEEVRALSHLMQTIFLDGLRPEDRENTLLLLLADHGQITVRTERALLLSDHPHLAETLVFPPLGEARAPFFHVRGGHLDAARRYLEGLDADLVCLDQAQLLESGLLGSGSSYAEVPHRLGDLVALMRREWIFVNEERDAERVSGRHGGLLSQEMLVPLLALRLDI
jgi:hypothetical protein